MKSTCGKRSQVMAGTLSILSLLLLAGCSPNMKALNKQDVISKAQVFGESSLITGVGADGGTSNRQSVPGIDQTISGSGSDSGQSSQAQQQTTRQQTTQQTRSNYNQGGSDGGSNSTGSTQGADGGQSSASSNLAGDNTSSNGTDGGNASISSSVNIVTGAVSSNGADGGTRAPPAMAYVNPPQPQLTKLPVYLFCSSNQVSQEFVDSHGNGKTTTLASATTALKLVIKENNSSGVLVCELPLLRADLLAKRDIDVASCNLDNNNKDYWLDVVDEEGTSLTYGRRGQKANSSDTIDANGRLVLRFDILADINHDPAENIARGITQAPNPAVNCSRNQSPLVINFTKEGAYDPGLLLTNPLFGSLFDIMGMNSDPAPYAKKLISWPQNSNYMFLGVLDRSGKITGIDQLFGNNTMGPDGKFARDGFAALAKHDDNKDGIIDAQDRIFAELVVWSDRNKNAVSGRTETRSLDSMGVQAIDLQYDPSFYDIDIYGNESIYKSVVVMKDGRNKLIFDLWFNVE